jgi:hypothetical protein
VTGFWTPSSAASRDGHAIPRTSWPAPAETPASDTPAAADRTTPILAQAAADRTTPILVQAAADRTTPILVQAAAAPRTITPPAVPPGPVVPASEPRSDRLYPVRLLVVIVVAALIGSILVLLLR